MRVAKLKRTKETRADRAVVPAYADVVAARDALLRQAVMARQVCARFSASLCVVLLCSPALLGADTAEYPSQYIDTLQEGNHRWRPASPYIVMWDEVEAAVEDERAAEEAAAAEAAAAAALAAAAAASSEAAGGGGGAVGGGGLRRFLRVGHATSIR